jgi:hypothetical protein
MSTITFKNTFKNALRCWRDELPGHQTPRAAAILQFFDRWLGESGDDGLWNKIVSDGEGVGRSREETFFIILSSAHLGFVFYDPKTGINSSKLAAGRRQTIEKYKRLAEYTDALADFYHTPDAGCMRAEYIADETVKERATLYEEEARNFRLTVEELEQTLPPRQTHSAKRDDAWERRKFVRMVARNLCRWFGKRYSDAVAAITDIAFPEEGHATTAKEVDDICRNRTR